MTATLTKWYEEHGRHEIFAGGKKVAMASEAERKVLALNEKLITNEEQRDLDQLGIAKNSREEKLRARAERLKKEAEDARMAQLYREVVLKEKTPKPEGGFIPLTALEQKPKPEVPEEVLGD